jgi:hypothetical protein
LLISAVTLAETIMVGRTREVELQLTRLVARLPFEVVPADPEAPWRISEFIAAGARAIIRRT